MSLAAKLLILGWVFYALMLLSWYVFDIDALGAAFAVGATVSFFGSIFLNLISIFGRR